jgi:hypothetical protein
MVDCEAERRMEPIISTYRESRVSVFFCLGADQSAFIFFTFHKNRLIVIDYQSLYEL